MTNIQQVFKLGYHQEMKGKGKKKGFLKNVGAKLNFEGRMGLYEVQVNKAFGDLLRVISQRNNFMEIVFPYQISNQCCSLSIHMDIFVFKKRGKEKDSPEDLQISATM